MMDKAEAAELIREALKALGPEAAAGMLAEAAGKPQAEARVRASEPVAIYAQEDVLGADGKVVHPRGHTQLVHPVDAREIMRRGLYAFTPPGPLRVAPAPLANPAAGDSAPAGGAVDQGAGATAPTEFSLVALPGVNEKVARAMEDAKLGTLAQLRAASLETIAAVPGVGGKMAERIVDYLDKNYPKEG